MCGIVGYIGSENASKHLISGLERLEYRGYDSAGIAVLDGSEILAAKEPGKLSSLRNRLDERPINGNIGIGHTRWATHGAPSAENSHPHTNTDGSIAVVHNGIIENYEEIKRFLDGKGYVFRSETDTEVIPHLIDYYYKDNLSDAVRQAIRNLEGSYAIGVISSHEPDKIIAVRKDSPLTVGIAKHGNFIASDIPAIISETRDVYLLDDGEIAVLTKNGAEIYDMFGNSVKKEPQKVTFTAEESEKGGYSHFMLKEIHEQPRAVRAAIHSRLDENLTLNFENIEFPDDIRKLYIVACGTAYHAGLVGKKAIETLAKIPCEACLASEIRYGEPLIDDGTAFLVISQSGETADTLAVLRMAKKLGCPVYAITNVVGSSVSREADSVIYTHAGPEIAVASTKAYTTQLAVLYLFAIYIAEKRGTTSQDRLCELKKRLFSADTDIVKIPEDCTAVRNLAEKLSAERDVYFIGRGLDYFTALEASLKLKEISYIHSEAYAAGELKHGPIALIEDGITVISVCTNPEISAKLGGNIREASARGAYTVGFTSCNSDISLYNEIITLPKTDPLLAPLAAAIPLQLLAYYTCTAKGFDVDKPRNLAKSVTVE